MPTQPRFERAGPRGRRRTLSMRLEPNLEPLADHRPHPHRPGEDERFEGRLGFVEALARQHQTRRSSNDKQPR